MSAIGRKRPARSCCAAPKLYCTRPVTAVRSTCGHGNRPSGCGPPRTCCNWCPVTPGARLAAPFLATSTWGIRKYTTTMAYCSVNREGRVKPCCHRRPSIFRCYGGTVPIACRTTGSSVSVTTSTGLSSKPHCSLHRMPTSKTACRRGRLSRFAQGEPGKRDQARCRDATVISK